MLTEEEIADVSLGTFYVFDKESAGRPGEQYASAGAEAAGAAEDAGAAEAAGLRGLWRLRLLYLAGVLPHLLSVSGLFHMQAPPYGGALLNWQDDHPHHALR